MFTGCATRFKHFCLGMGVLISLSASASEPGSSETALDPALPRVESPRIFAEGLETQLTSAQLQALLPWAKRSDLELANLLEAIGSKSPTEQKPILIRGIRDVVLASAPKDTELLMRYVLNRSVQIIAQIDACTDLSRPGVVDQEVRVLIRSIELARQYFHDDAAALAASSPLAPEPFAKFGTLYAQLLMELDQSLVNAKAQYSVGVLGLGLLQWDLYRDQRRTEYAPVIWLIHSTLESFGDAEPSSDEVAISRMKEARRIYLKAIQQIGEIDRQADEAHAAAEAAAIARRNDPSRRIRGIILNSQGRGTVTEYLAEKSVCFGELGDQSGRWVLFKMKDPSDSCPDYNESVSLDDVPPESIVHLTATAGPSFGEQTLRYQGQAMGLIIGEVLMVLCEGEFVYNLRTCDLQSQGNQLSLKLDPPN